MIRLLSILIATMLVLPAFSWGADCVPSGTSLIAPSQCCCPQVDEESEAPTQAQLEKTCCCKPTTPGQGVEVGPVILSEGHSWQTALPAALYTVGPLTPSSPRQIPDNNAARAPPPSGSLFSQHVALLI